MVYDDKKAWEKLKEALKIAEECEPLECDCEKCPIGEPIQLLAHDAGVKVVASLCSIFSCLQDVCLEPKEHRYRKD